MALKENELLRDARLTITQYEKTNQFSKTIYSRGIDTQRDFLWEKFPHLKNRIISHEESEEYPEKYIENGKVVGLVSDFRAVKFIMYTNPKQNQILKTRFITE